eukprot:3241676-Prymnesium_polylepis.2
MHCSKHRWHRATHAAVAMPSSRGGSQDTRALGCSSSVARGPVCRAPRCDQAWVSDGAGGRSVCARRPWHRLGGSEGDGSGVWRATARAISSRSSCAGCPTHKSSV